MIPPKNSAPAPHDKSSFLDRMRAKTSLRARPKAAPDIHHSFLGAKHAESPVQPKEKTQGSSDKSLFHGHESVDVGGYEGVMRELLADSEMRAIARAKYQEGDSLKPVSDAKISEIIRGMVKEMDAGQDKGKISVAEAALRLRKMHAHHLAEKRHLNASDPSDLAKMQAMDKEMHILEKKFKPQK